MTVKEDSQRLRKPQKGKHMSAHRIIGRDDKVSYRLNACHITRSNNLYKLLYFIITFYIYYI